MESSICLQAQQRSIPSFRFASSLPALKTLKNFICHVRQCASLSCYFLSSRARIPSWPKVVAFLQSHDPVTTCLCTGSSIHLAAITSGSTPRQLRPWARGRGTCRCLEQLRRSARGRLHSMQKQICIATFGSWAADLPAVCGLDRAELKLEKPQDR